MLDLWLSFMASSMEVQGPSSGPKHRETNLHGFDWFTSLLCFYHLFEPLCQSSWWYLFVSIGVSWTCQGTPKEATHQIWFMVEVVLGSSNNIWRVSSKTDRVVFVVSVQISFYCSFANITRTGYIRSSKGLGKQIEWLVILQRKKDWLLYLSLVVLLWVLGAFLADNLAKKERFASSPISCLFSYESILYRMCTIYTNGFGEHSMAHFSSHLCTMPLRS